MNWKEFLKPTAKKIMWTIGIGIIAIFILSFSGLRGMGCNFNYSCPFNDISAFISILLSPPLGILFNYNLFYTLLNGVISKDLWSYTLLNGIIPNDLFLPSLVLSIFYWYFLSCFILWNYNKFRKYYLRIGAILIILMCFYAFLESYTFQPFVPLIEVERNSGCKEYVNQQPSCSNWSLFNITVTEWSEENSKYFNESITFKDFMIDNFCLDGDENCARRVCACPGY